MTRLSEPASTEQAVERPGPTGRADSLCLPQVSGWMVVACVLLAPMFLTDGEGWKKWINYFKKDTREWIARL